MISNLEQTTQPTLLEHHLIRDDVREELYAALGDCVMCPELNLDAYLKTPIDDYVEAEGPLLGELVHTIDPMRSLQLRRDVVLNVEALNSSVLETIAVVGPVVAACREAQVTVPATMPKQCWRQHMLAGLLEQHTQLGLL